MGKEIKVKNIKCVGTHVSKGSSSMFIEVNGIEVSIEDIVSIKVKDR